MRLRALLFAALPSSIKVRWLRYRGHQIGRNVRIGMTYLDVRHLVLHDHATIGHFNVVKNVDTLVMGERSQIGQLNLVTSSHFYQERLGEGTARLELGPRSVITMRHYIDVQAPVRIGAHSILAGLNSVVLTHQKGIVELNEAKPVTIGDRVYVGSNSVVHPGAVVGDHIMIASGSVVSGKLLEPHSLYSHERIHAVKRLGPEAAYFKSDDPLASVEELAAAELNHPPA